VYGRHYIQKQNNYNSTHICIGAEYKANKSFKLHQAIWESLPCRRDFGIASEQTLHSTRLRYTDLLFLSSDYKFSWSLLLRHNKIVFFFFIFCTFKWFVQHRIGTAHPTKYLNTHAKNSFNCHPLNPKIVFNPIFITKILNISVVKYLNLIFLAPFISNFSKTLFLVSQHSVLETETMTKKLKGANGVPEEGAYKPQRSVSEVGIWVTWLSRFWNQGYWASLESWVLSLVNTLECADLVLLGHMYAQSIYIY